MSVLQNTDNTSSGNMDAVIIDLMNRLWYHSGSLRMRVRENDLRIYCPRYFLRLFMDACHREYRYTFNTDVDISVFRSIEVLYGYENKLIIAAIDAPMFTKSEFKIEIEIP